jgi:DNA-binding transcriptional ArsR family regulator
MNHRAGDDSVFRAMADPVRRMLLDRLHRGDGQTLGELCEGLGVTRQAVSKHLAVLEAAALVTTRREGRSKLHFLNAVPIQAIADRWIEKYRAGQARAVGDSGRGPGGDER